MLEKFTGVGTLVIAGAGNFIELNPAKYGGKIQVDTGCVVAFQDTITYGIERVGALNAQTMVTAMFGGEGLNLATLEGDGTVILQSMTYDGMANALFARAARMTTRASPAVSSAPPRAETATTRKDARMGFLDDLKKGAKDLGSKASEATDDLQTDRKTDQLLHDLGALTWKAEHGPAEETDRAGGYGSRPSWGLWSRPRAR